MIPTMYPERARRSNFIVAGREDYRGGRGEEEERKKDDEKRGIDEGSGSRERERKRDRRFNKNRPRMSYDRLPIP